MHMLVLRFYIQYKVPQHVLRCAVLCRSHSIGDLSRNRTVGLKLGRGMKLPDIIESMHGAVAEGVLTSRAAHDLAKKLGVEVPIIDGIHSIIHGEAGSATTSGV